MARRAKKEDDYLGPSRGWAKVLHRTVMFLLLPLRKPWWCLLILLVMFLAPTFRGVKPAEVHLWYWNKITHMTNKTAGQIAQTAQQVLPSVEKNLDKAVDAVATKVEEVKTAAEPTIINQPLRQVRRQMFGKADTATAPLKTIKIEEKVSVEQIANPSTASKPIVKTRLKNLRYLDIPTIMAGKAMVLNANELMIEDTVVFLYGVFVAPTSQAGKNAEEQLRLLISQSPVNCNIIAYTYQNIPTAMCSVNGVEINRWLVDRGYSKNVALD